MAPFATYRQTDGWTLYYAANGDPSKPDYVLPDRACDGSRPVEAGSRHPAGDWHAKLHWSDARYGSVLMRMERPIPCVFVDGTDVYMYYAGLDCGSGVCKFQILRSKSPDGGSSFRQAMW